MPPARPYDAFLSHNRADKAWVRRLAARLSDAPCLGRPLRPWLDEQFLDPGIPGQLAELTSALDRSRIFVLVLSPAALGSPWVQQEIDYMLSRRDTSEVVVLRHAPCAVPDALAGCTRIDGTGGVPLDEVVDTLTAALCPQASVSLDDVRAEVDAAWDAAVGADPGGLDAVPTPEREAVLQTLMRHDLDDPLAEGLALAGWAHAGRRLAEALVEGHPAAYNLKLLLGECLAVALEHSFGARLAARRLLDGEHPRSPDPAMSFVVARAYSKLAELDPERLDPSLLLQLATRLDEGPLTGPREATSVLLGRLVAKLRGTELGEVLVRLLSRGGTVSRIAAIGGVAMCETREPSVCLTETLAARVADEVPATGASAPPSLRTLGELHGIELDQPPVIARQLASARVDLKRSFGIIEQPYPLLWTTLRRHDAATTPYREPFLGRVVKVTPEQMEDLAPTVGPADVVCCTELRVVDALFDAASALIIPAQESDDPQPRRLRGRTVPHAMLGPETLEALHDGDIVVIRSDEMLWLTPES